MSTAVNTNYPVKINQASTNTAGGVNLGPILALADFPSGGSIGSAATTVDIASIFHITQTTASQTLTLPTPTILDGKIIMIINTGTNSFTVASTSIATGTGLLLRHTNSTWNVIGGSYSAASGVFTGAITTSSPSANFGFATGAGGAVTQATNKSTGVTLNTNSGAITMNNASLAGAASVSFTLTNSSIAANDIPVVAVKSGASTGLYTASVTATAAGSCQITVTNIGATAGEVVVINFGLIAGVAS